jgi:ubiquinone/menaquinone biosynthesis C-methylase UbiE
MTSRLIVILSKYFRKTQQRKYAFSKKRMDGDEYNIDYALYKQYLMRVKNGYPYDFFGKRVLEIGCGHGGIAVFLAVNGAESVLGIDLNTKHLHAANQFKSFMQQKLGTSKELPVTFRRVNAYQLDLDPDSYDLIIADNVFEHFDNTEKVLMEAYRVLKPGGQLIIPSFNALKSKYGAHVKYGIGMPWVNVFFSEKSICKALLKIAEDDPSLFDAYPGLRKGADTLAELREYKDLNGMTHSRFRREAGKAGFEIRSFNVFAPFATTSFCFRALYKIKRLQYTWFGDIFSRGASAVLSKPTT